MVLDRAMGMVCDVGVELLLHHVLGWLSGRLGQGGGMGVCAISMGWIVRWGTVGGAFGGL